VTNGRLLARNSALNLFGHVLPIILAIVAIPPLVRGLGAERFGVLTLAWAAIGYFSLFELGLSRALTQAVAQRLGNGGEKEVPAITWTAILLLFVLGIVGGVVLAVLTPVLVNELLNIPAEWRQEATFAFWILSASLPLVVTTVGLRGLMEAHQHFGVATALRAPLAAFNFVGPLLLLPFSRSLVPAVTILAIGRAIGFIAHLVVGLRVYPELRQGIVVRLEHAVPLLRFGGWTTISNVVSPMMVFLDRFVVGAMLPLAAVAHYVTPYEAVVKLLIIPMSLLGVMLPAFASVVTTNRPLMAQLYDRSLRTVMLVTFPVVLFAIVLAREGLLLWVGPVLPRESTLVLQWLAIGVFFSAIAQAPFTALQSAGMPDVIAKIHVLELPVYMMAIFWLITVFGLPGVAIAWTLRAALDAIALIWAAHRRLGVPFAPRIGGYWPPVLMVLTMAGGALLDDTQAKLPYLAVVLLAFVLLSWFTLLTPAERESFRDWFRRPAGIDDARLEELA
jgi:O-antigen/teichoic acid export membrane protein